MAYVIAQNIASFCLQHQGILGSQIWNEHYQNGRRLLWKGRSSWCRMPHTMSLEVTAMCAVYRDCLPATCTRDKAGTTTIEQCPARRASSDKESELIQGYLQCAFSMLHIYFSCTYSPICYNIRRLLHVLINECWGHNEQLSNFW